MPAPTAEEEVKQAKYVNHFCPLGEQPPTTSSTAAASLAIHLDPERVFAEQTKDALLLRVRQWVSEGKPPAKLELQGKSRDEQQYASQFAALGLDDHRCLTITATTLTGEQICYLLPPDLHWETFFLAPLACHKAWTLWLPA